MNRRCGRWCDKIIIETPDLAAQKLRIPQIASLKSLHLPVAPMLISTIIDAYETKNPSNKKTKRQNLEPIRNLIAFTKSITLDDLTTEKLLEWREHTEQRLESPDYRAAYYSRVRGVVRFGL
jgi:hypothetical protein